MRLARMRAPQNDPDFVFEIKHDGFRALCYLEAGAVRVVSRRANVYRNRRVLDLAGRLAQVLRARDAILDGELVCLDGEGRSVFMDMLRRRRDPVFVAFDLLWLNGQDLRDLPLLERKARLREVVPAGSGDALYLEHIEDRGIELFQEACRRDLEGIVAKLATAPYWSTERLTSWVKVKNPNLCRLRHKVGYADQRIMPCAPRFARALRSSRQSIAQSLGIIWQPLVYLLSGGRDAEVGPGARSRGPHRGISSACARISRMASIARLFAFCP
jgi:hypothetical protein